MVKQTRTRLDGLELLRRIVLEIRLNKYPTKAELARLIGRDVRTVQRLLGRLRREHKAPIEFDKRANGFCFTDPDWKVDGLQLGREELNRFFRDERRLRLAGEMTKTRQSLAGLLAYLPDEVMVDRTRIEAAIDIAREPALPAHPDTLLQLAESALNRETLFIHYFSQRLNCEIERYVDVLLLHNYHGEWYAVGWDHTGQEVRDFHAGRISRFFNTRRKFVVPEGWDARRYLSQGFGMFRGGREVSVIVEFDAYQARYVRERRYHITQINEELPDDRLRVRFETTEMALEQVARWLMQFGEHALAVEPQGLVDLVRERLRRSLQLYETEAQPARGHDEQ